MTVAPAVARWLPLFVRPADPVELRFLGVGRPGRVHAGWMLGSDAPALAGKVAALAAEAEGVYFTPQVLGPAVLARAPRGHFGNVVKARDGKGTVPRLTRDEDVAARRYLLIDVDPVRPAKVGATDAEKAAALAVVGASRDYLAGRGFAAPAVVDSGNGWHLYYRLPAPLPGGTRDDADGLARLLRVLAGRFDTPAARIDTTVFNPSRIMKLPGTWARKGDDTPDRPHRPDAVTEVPHDWHPG